MRESQAQQSDGSILPLAGLGLGWLPLLLTGPSMCVIAVAVDGHRMDLRLHEPGRTAGVARSLIAALANLARLSFRHANSLVRIADGTVNRTSETARLRCRRRVHEL